MLYILLLPFAIVVKINEALKADCSCKHQRLKFVLDRRVCVKGKRRISCFPLRTEITFFSHSPSVAASGVCEKYTETDADAFTSNNPKRNGTEKARKTHSHAKRANRKKMVYE